MFNKTVELKLNTSKDDQYLLKISGDPGKGEGAAQV